MHAADAIIDRLAAAQMELVTRDGLLAEGVTRSAIAHRVRIARLRPVHPGVHTTARGPLSYEQRALAAVLACTGTRALGDGWAAGLWRMLSEPPGPPEVRREGDHRAGPSGVRVRRTQRLARTTHRGVPVTTPARTLLDLAATGHPGLELAVDEAHARRLVTRSELAACAATSARGAARLRALLDEAPGFTRQEAERRLRSLILRAQLPRALHNVRIHGHEVDAAWPAARLIAEVDGWAAHGTRRAFERDRARDAHLHAAGHQVIRFTWRQLTSEPEAVAARLGAALATRAAA